MRLASQSVTKIARRKFTPLRSVFCRMLSGFVEFDGYYLESDPCLVCNNPEVPFQVIFFFITNAYTIQIRNHACSMRHYFSCYRFISFFLIYWLDVIINSLVKIML